MTWVKNFLVLVLSLGFLDILLPSTGLRSFVKWVMSLVVIAFLLQPLLNLERAINLSEWERWLDSSRQVPSVETSLAMGQRILEGGEKPMLEIAANQQTHYLRSMLLVLDGVADAEVVLQMGERGSPERVLVSILPEVAAGSDGANTEQLVVGGQVATPSVGSAAPEVVTGLGRKIRRLVASFYQIDEADVIIVFQD
ncbi:MAG: stage III sporulation protein AF [Firmicutes bacterium]|nr:stage III sporulation protein AF [Bacillota bacterium]